MLSQEVGQRNMELDDTIYISSSRSEISIRYVRRQRVRVIIPNVIRQVSFGIDIRTSIHRPTRVQINPTGNLSPELK